MRYTIRYLCSVIRFRRRCSCLLLLSPFLYLVFVLLIIDWYSPASRAAWNDEKESTTTQRVILKTVTTSTVQKERLWPLDENGRSLKTDFLVLDITGFFGSGASEGVQVRCRSSNTTFTWTQQLERIEEVDFVISHGPRNLDSSPFDKLRLNGEQQQYTMAFIMESEAHSSTGHVWARYNFKMYYNLNDSYPEPATYFSTVIHTMDLLRPPLVSFKNKTKQADIVWIISNCDAYNGRKDFVEELMKEIPVDCYGACLNNRQGYAGRMSDNACAYSQYKFVIAIENSNCVDYVSEKLVQVVESGSIPIVAGRDGRPDYRRYMPEHSYINIFDYATIRALADELKRIASNQTLYESYLWFKKHQFNMRRFPMMSLQDKVKQFTDVVGANATMIQEGIIGRETGENKICKLIRFVRRTPWQEIAAHQGTDRLNASVACLPEGSIITHFNLSAAPSSSNRTVKVS